MRGVNMGGNDEALRRQLAELWEGCGIWRRSS